MYHVPVYVTGTVVHMVHVDMVPPPCETHRSNHSNSFILSHYPDPPHYLMLKMVPVVPQLPSMSLPNCVGEHDQLLVSSSPAFICEGSPAQDQTTLN